MSRGFLALLVLLPSLAFAAPYDALTKAELGKMSGPQAGQSAANLARFMQNRQPFAQKHQGLFLGVARKMMASRPSTLGDPTHAQADALFERLKNARLGSDVPDDFCFMRADVGAHMIEQQGFNVRKVNAIATGGKALHVAAPNTVEKEVTWRYHVAPIVKVDGVDYVLDPSLGKAKMTLRGWKAKMHDRGMNTIETDAAQLNFSTPPPANAQAEVDQLAHSLSQIGGIRTYERFRKRALDKAAASSTRPL